MIVVGAMTFGAPPFDSAPLIDDRMPCEDFLALVSSGQAIAFEPIELAEPCVLWTVRDPECAADRRLSSVIVRDLRQGRYIVRDGPESAALRAAWTARAEAAWRAAEAAEDWEAMRRTARLALCTAAHGAAQAHILALARAYEQLGRHERADGLRAVAARIASWP